jgi:hypothetical protein
LESSGVVSARDNVKTTIGSAGLIGGSGAANRVYNSALSWVYRDETRLKNAPAMPAKAF